MSQPPNVKDLLQRNADTITTHQPIDTFVEHFKAGKQAPDVAIVTCADPRCIPERFLNLNIWDAVVVRCVGADVKEVLPTLVAIDMLAGLKEIMIIDHTNCGGQMFRDDDVKAMLKTRAPELSNDIDKMTFGAITGSLEDHVRESVEFAKSSPLLRAELRDRITGYIYDIKDGTVKQVS